MALCPLHLFPFPARNHGKHPKWPTTNSCTTSRLQCTLSIRASSATPTRRTANYQPNLWSYDFIQSLPTEPQEKNKENVTRMENLKDYVSRRLGEEEMATVDKLDLVDTITQLGIGFRFKKEIKILLENIYNSLEAIMNTEMKEDLRATALLFQLLRCYGFDVSQDIIMNNFKDERGIFKTNLMSTKAMLSLYDASYHAKDGEDMLVDARNYALRRLKEEESALEAGLIRERVLHSLDFPVNWMPPRVHAHWFIHAYEKAENVDDNILELAKLDFNMVQNTYKMEQKQLSRWLKSLDVEKKLSYGRIRLVESFLGSIFMAFEPEFGNFRIWMTKINFLLCIIDDTYDIYGSVDELEIFTSAVERWDLSKMEELPEYMQILFHVLFNTVNETANDVLITKGLHVTSFLHKALTDFCKANLLEARWYFQGHIPTFKEYLDNARITVFGPIIALYLYFGRSQHITKEGFEYLVNDPYIMRQMALVLRLCNDLASFKAEGERGDVPKSIQCYIIEKGVSEEVACMHIRSMIDDGFRELIGYQTSCTSFQQSFKDGIVNLARLSLWMYRDGDGLGARPDHETKDKIVSLLIKPVVIGTQNVESS